MKTILFVHQSAECYGSDKMLLALVTGLDKRRFKPIVSLPSEGPLKKALETQGVPTLVLPSAKISRSVFTVRGLFRLPQQVFSAVWALEKAFKQRRIDIVHSNTLAVLGGAVWAKLSGIPHVWHVHEIIQHPWLAHKAFPFMVALLGRKVAAISRAVEAFLVSGWPYLEKKITVIWDGIPAAPPADEIRVREFRKEIGVRPGDVIIALVGRINRWKGQLLLLKAAELLISKGEDRLMILMVGGPPPGQEHFGTSLWARIQASPAKDRVKVLGFMPHIRLVWDACDIGVVPSTEPEPFGIVALEAMAASRPVVAADHGGLAEIVVHKETGLLFMPNSAEDLADKLAELVADRAKRERYGSAGRARFEAEFSHDRYVRAFEALYDAM